MQKYHSNLLKNCILHYIDISIIREKEKVNSVDDTYIQ